VANQLLIDVERLGRRHGSSIAVEIGVRAAEADDGRQQHSGRPAESQGRPAPRALLLSLDRRRSQCGDALQRRAGEGWGRLRLWQEVEQGPGPTERLRFHACAWIEIKLRFDRARCLRVQLAIEIGNELATLFLAQGSGFRHGRTYQSSAGASGTRSPSI